MGAEKRKLPDPSQILNLADLEKAALTRAIAETGGKIVAASRLLGIGKTTAYRKAKLFGIPTRAATCIEKRMIQL
jgi:transcriptional regulator of acetoin/glycerol metabolism